MRTTYAHDGLVFDVTESGPADGTPVVLLHGFPQRASCWSQVTPLLNDAGLRTIAPDQRGYSAGARPHGRRAYRMSTLVGDVVALVERTGGPVHLVGHDWGAAVAWSLALTRPELVSSLTALSVPHPGALRRATLTSGSQALRSWYVGLFNVPFLVEGVVRVGPHLLDPALRRNGMDDEQVARFHEEVVEDGAFGPALGWYRGLPFAMLPPVPGVRRVQRRVRQLPGYATLQRVPGVSAVAGRADRSDRSDRSGKPPTWSRPVTVPTTFVWSTGDSAISRAAAEGCDEFVEAKYRYVELDGVSHWIPEEAPGVVAEAVLERVRGEG